MTGEFGVLFLSKMALSRELKGDRECFEAVNCLAAVVEFVVPFLVGIWSA